MGRVARFKKIRSCDPYSRENRGRVALDRVGVWGLGDSGRKAKKKSLVAQKYQAMKSKRRGKDYASNDDFDLPPNDQEDEFDSTTFVVQKKTKPLSFADLETTKQSEHEIKKEESRINKLLKIDAQVEPKKGPVAVPGKMPGESKNAYRKRVKTEITLMTKESKQQSKQSLRKKEKKKEFFKNKKLKKKGTTSTVPRDVDSNDLSGNESDDDLVTAEKAVRARTLDAPKFGEQAERPPDFKLLPRGATKRKDANKQNSKKRKAMDDEDVQVEQETMELMRRKVQAQYALVRQKRRGQFHL